VDRKAKNRSERKARIKIPVEVAARAVIHDSGETYAGFPILLCMACSSFFLFALKRPDNLVYDLPQFCPNCGRQRAVKNQEDSHDG
jgi:hypothetical protein